ncbi:MAG: SDR family NAD(P)-dependent oxidoreductase [candidate division Zixibacteria bacterium]|nr:SDR family NAD(P)-dependent oxidoreductase [candidate division Zixibacteria bacterium]MDD5425822.1 SDR family NAD(P)-dependent oxidoreductase [candidate division Zixibacteria bacterium]
MERCLITGASRGVGRAIAVRLAREGRILLLHGRDRKALDESCRMVHDKGAVAMALQADISTLAGIEELVAMVGQDDLNFLVNNAGVAHVGPFEQTTPKQWQETLAVNISAPFWLIQKLYLRMKPGSAVVNILSVAAHTAFPRWSSYCMSKSALEGLTRSLREELRPRGIRVINVYPQAAATALWDKIEGTWSKDKMLPPEEIAEAVVYAVERPGQVQVDSISLGHIEGNQ